MPGLMELARRLHEERIFIKHEQDTIWKLNEQVQLNAEQLSHLFWCARQHYLNLNKLITNSSQATPLTCSRRLHQLENMQFVDAYKELGYQESMYSQFLEAFINNPTLAAACLAYGDKLGLDNTSDAACIIVLSCYGNRLVTDDHKHLLELVGTLMLLQLASEDQPRRLLQKGSCAFSVVFKLFTESLLVGKLFLTSALSQPILEVLMDDELFLETNIQKVLSRLSTYEIQRRFGNENSPEFQEKLKKHVADAEESLSKICANFVESLYAAMCCFPQSLGWIIARSYHIVKEAGLVTQAEARALCADFLLQQFVCPAIVNPELYGVTGDIPVGDLTRFNLMQIAQVLQVMAHWDESNQQGDAFHAKLDKEPMRRLIDAVINSCNSDGIPSTHVAPHGYASSVVFFTLEQLHQLIQFLRNIQQSDVRGVDQASLATILSHLPSQPPACMQRMASMNGTASNLEENGLNLTPSSGRLTPSGGSSGDLFGSPLHSSPTAGKRRMTKSVRPKGKLHKRDDSVEGMMDDSAGGDSISSTFTPYQDAGEVVLVISLSSSGVSYELPGTMAETEVMELQNNQNSAPNLAAEDASLDAQSLVETEGLDKQSRFSLYSGGSDLSEIGEELPTEDGISRTSGSSSSDMDQGEGVAADDSSFHAISSHGGNQDEDGDQESVTHVNDDEALKALRRKLPTSRESIEDKMRKFEIRQELGVRFADHGVPGGSRRFEGGPSGSSAPVDARSDTWSMDVYASDSEPATEQDSQSERLREIAEDPAERIRNAPASVASFLTLTRDDDSRSDVWSVEVLHSDSEPPDAQSEDRLQEFETESANAGGEDTMEDNRSQASTPGLSAASGFSGVSGLSLDNNQAKAGDEQWLSSERSYGKGPYSISPDADELIQMTRGESESAASSHGGGGSSNSSETNDRTLPNATASPLPRLRQGNSQSPISMVSSSKPRGEALEVTRQSVSFDETAKKGDDDHFHMHKSEMAEKTVAWNIPSTEASTSMVHSPDNSGLALMEFDENINTIKRSPYKRQGKESARPPHLDANPESSDNPASQGSRMTAWDEKPQAEAIPHSVSITLNNQLLHDSTTGPSIVNHNPASVFLPVSSKKNHSEVLKDFDPLMEAKCDRDAFGESSVFVRKQDHPDSGSNETTALSLDTMNAALVDIHTPGGDSTLSESNGAVMEVDTSNETTKLTSTPSRANGWPKDKFKERPASSSSHVRTSTSVDFDFGFSRSNKGIDRKKPWWRSNRIAASLSKRKATTTGKLSGSPISDSNVSLGSDSMRRVGNVESNSSHSDDSTTKITTIGETYEPGEDIMQKYMKKVSSQISTNSGEIEKDSPGHTTDSLQGSDGNSVTQKQPSVVNSDDIEIQNVNNSLVPEVLSHQHHNTVTTTTEGMSVAWVEASSKMTASGHAIPVTCPSKSYESFRKSDTDLKEDAKRKLRIVLSAAEPLPEPPSQALLLLGISSGRFKYAGDVASSASINGSDHVKLRDKLLSFLRVQHAEALILQDHSRIAQLHEVTRCVDALDDAGCKHVVKTLWREYKARSSYIAYLVRARQHLLSVSSYLRHVTECTERDKTICRRYFTSQYVRLFLKRKESQINQFRSNFMRSNALDEKVTLVGNFLSWLYGQVVEHQIWEGSSEEQLTEVESFIERTIFTDVHKQAMFPNGDGDILRDQLYHEHISRISAIITPAHPALQVRSKYLLECPWPSAQREACALAAHRSPRGKLDAALRCCRAVMHLLKLADENQAPGADDFTPVLVFVLIQANPPHLLSTVQYVNSFLGEHLSGEDAYWWMQFTAATEFIKTIDERK